VNPPARARAVVVLFAIVLAAAEARGAHPSRAQQIAALPEADRVWLTEFVAPIIQPVEEKIFLELTDESQRDAFKEDFWERREKENLPPPLGPGYRARYKERRDVLDRKYDGWQNDAGRTVLRWGEPDAIFTPHCEAEEVFRGLEVWTYSHMEIAGQPAVHHIFYRLTPNLPRRLWTVHDSNANVFQTNQCRRTFEQLAADCKGVATGRCGPCRDRCEVYAAWVEIVKRQGSPAGALSEISWLMSYPKVATEGLEKQKGRWTAAAPPAATTASLASPPPRVSASPVAPPATPTQTPAPTGTATRASTPTETPQPTRSPSPEPTATPGPAAVPPPPPPPPAPAPAPGAAGPPSPSPTPTTRPTRVASATPSATPTTRPSPSSTATRTPTLPPPPPATATRTVSPAATGFASATPTATRRPTAAASPAAAPTGPAGGLRRLTPDEIRERLETLEPEYKDFVDLARPLITEDELSRFLQLSGHDKDAFIHDFWKRHE
jgi:GWxTD domain-containing protein